MKITVGLGSIDDYIDYVEAGAEEIFLGYVPLEWTLKYGQLMPLNRREVRYYNVQVGSESEMRILKKMVDVYKVPVAITCNGLYYRPEQYEEIHKYIEHCVDLGFNRFIIADMALLAYLTTKEIASEIEIHVSGELSEMNGYTLELIKKMNITRVIFNRKTTIDEMKKMISANPEIQYEAFAMNEKCHFQGAFCSSLHCDEMLHVCRLPYRVEGQSEIQSETGEGCSLCKIGELERAGVNYLKIVSRGNYSESTIKDIKILKKVMEMGHKLDRSDYEMLLKDEFRKKCSKNCYYFS